MTRLLLLFCFYSICGISKAGFHELNTIQEDSIELHIRRTSINAACKIPYLIDPVFSFDLIADDGAIINFSLKSQDTILKISSSYSTLSVPAEGFIYGRKCYYKIDNKEKIEVSIENNIPSVNYQRTSKKNIYDFWSLFYRRCPYYRVNRVLFGSDLNDEKNKKQLYDLRKELYHQALALLDSLKRSNIATKSADYIFLKETLKYEWLADCLLTSQQVAKISRSDTEFTQEINTFDKVKNDSLIHFPFYQVFLQNYLERVLLNDRRLQTNSHGFTYKYYEAIDRIDSLPASLSKEYLLKYCLQKTEENFDTKTTLQALSKVKDLRSPAIANLIQTIKERVELRSQLEKHVNEFVTVDLKLYSLMDIIDANKGKFLYVDIWASWCVPCRKAMVFSSELRESFKDQNIAFIYFSVDEEFEKWKAAAEQEGLTLYPYSYKAANPRDNKLMLSINANEIPRYLIFDDQGKLIHANAPGPDSKEIRTLLKSYLKH